jgi:hypothetical protein
VPEELLDQARRDLYVQALGDEIVPATLETPGRPEKSENVHSAPGGGHGQKLKWRVINYLAAYQTFFRPAGKIFPF